MTDESSTLAEILEGIDRDRERAVRVLTPNLVLLNGIWGTFWLVAPFVLFLAFLPGSALPLWVATVVATALFVVAMIVGTVTGVRSGAGLKGPSTVQGGIFGAANGLGFVILTVIGLRLGLEGATPVVLMLYFPAVACLVLGILYFSAAAIFNDRNSLVMGAAILLAAFGSLIAPTPFNLLVIACIAGTSFVATVVVAAVRPNVLSSALWTVDNG
ncbi:hypothetical protein [Glaciihabitans sp. UYNi722]|uniref:hypothetical protein n=1 Tax=Glaciihabitans sp. UYNi722 TaxID=3156344 RepID=UPI0033935F7B